MSYPKYPRLAFALSLTGAPDEAKARLLEARDAALKAEGDLQVWAGVDSKTIEPEMITATLGRPAGAVDAVIEVSAPNATDPAVLVDVAGEVGRIVADVVNPEASDVLLGLSHSALAKGTSSHVLVITLCRDARVDPEMLVRWWEIHHSRYNMYSPLGRKVYQQVLSYELTNATEEFKRAAAESSGIRASRDIYESLYINDVPQFLQDLGESGFGEPNVLDEEGFISHEWRIGTPEEAAEARRTGRDTLYMSIIELLS